MTVLWFCKHWMKTLHVTKTSYTLKAGGKMKMTLTIHLLQLASTLLPFFLKKSKVLSALRGIKSHGNTMSTMQINLKNIDNKATEEGNLPTWS